MSDESAGAALAVFVKTPAYSPVKTRLAADAGAAVAQAVYAECLALMRRRMRAAAAEGVEVWWAVGEEQAVDEWRADGEFNAMWTGAGDLGQRLHTVYAALRRRARRALLAGADCPQLPAAALFAAAQGEGTMVGPARDGGFYLFASGARLSMQEWGAPQYSSPRTLAMLEAALAAADDSAGVGHVQRMPPLSDIDDVHSLAQCVQEFADAAEARELARLLAAARPRG